MLPPHPGVSGVKGLIALVASLGDLTDVKRVILACYDYPKYRFGLVVSNYLVSCLEFFWLEGSLLCLREKQTRFTFKSL